MPDLDRILYSDDCLNVLNDELALPTGVPFASGV